MKISLSDLKLPELISRILYLKSNDWRKNCISIKQLLGLLVLSKRAGMKEANIKVLVILGHPRKDSYNAALAESYVAGAKAARAHVEFLHLADLHFDLHVQIPSPQDQLEEEDLKEAKRLIKWADHLVFVYPAWWGNMPALLKGFIDRVFVPGFAFYEIQPDAFKKLLRPKTGQLIITMDTPVLIDRLINGAPSRRSLENATLKFCGVSPVRSMLISPVKHSSDEKKEEWLTKVYHQGKSLENGVLTPWEKLMNQIMPWIKAIRLQFYPMTFFAYAIGAFLFAELAGPFNPWIFVLGYLVLFLIEVITVFSNDYLDRESDRLNKHFSTFSGGSRVLVDGELSEKAYTNSLKYLLVVLAVLCVFMGIFAIASVMHVLLVTVLIFFIAVSYTAAPLSFSYNGWGEIVVGFTHSFAVIICGFVYQGGGLNNIYSWVVGIPLFFSIVPAIIMAGIPDHDADRAAGKGTLVVRLGKVRATYLAGISVLLSMSSVLLLKKDVLLDRIYSDIIYTAFLHGAWLLYLLYQYINKPEKPDRIDGIMGIALMYILWYTLVPFFNLL